MVEVENSLNNTSKRFSLAQKQALCDAWSKTNLSKNEFIRQHNLPRIFFSWCNKLLGRTIPNKKSTTNNVGFVPVLSTDKTSNINVPAKETNIEAKIACNGLVINLCLTRVELINLLKELANGTTVIRH